jgi:uncharacterized protein
LRGAFRRTAYISSKVVKAKQDTDEAAKYSDYFDWREPLKRCSSHRLLAMRRGEAEGILRISIDPVDDDECIERLQRQWVRMNASTACRTLINEAAEDSYKRLLKPSIETEFNNLSKEQAMVHVQQMITDYHIEAIAIGNGTASRETRSFVEDCINNGAYETHESQKAQKTHETQKPQLFVVSEDGASVYSASKVAREEFPDEDVTVRGAVSIGRRLMDPLAELVKIDPKSIGVGQYQHDVDQTKLKHQLDQTVESCVNLVGVNLNTASSHLLQYVSGLGPALAKNIVDYRKEHGPFSSRAQLKKVPRLGPAAYQQCAGFLRIPGAKNPLDNSAVHPESYDIVEHMAKDQGCTVSDLIEQKDLRARVDIKRYATEEVGLPTLTDIMHELEKPGRDPREQIEEFEFDSRVQTMDDLEEGMILPGIVTNITNFGAFVDIGVHQDGLVHISQMANRRIAHPTDVVKLHQHVTVKVIEVDHRRHRISLTMKL